MKKRINYFMANAVQISGLVHMQITKKPIQNNVQVNFVAGCRQSILKAVNEH